MNIFLVRHGLSMANLDQKINLTTADHAVALAEEGHEQAQRAGNFLRQYISYSMPVDCSPIGQIRMWTSPYKRTRQTADAIMAEMCKSIWATPFGPIDRKEKINLAEQQFGTFDGVPEDELPKQFPVEWAHYQKCVDHGGKFWARMPMGESRFDVAVRVHELFGTFHRDAERHGINTLIVVCHGTVARAFTMQWFNYSPEWFEAERNPRNCSIRLIIDSKDHGYIYEGE